MSKQSVLVCLVMCFMLTVSANFPSSYNSPETAEDTADTRNVALEIANSYLSAESQREVPIDNLDDDGVMDLASVPDKEVAEVLSPNEEGERLQLLPTYAGTDETKDVTEFLTTWTIKLWWLRCLRRGMTWRRRKHFCPSHGTGMVGCAGCNPYQGDTICWYKRPILCINDQDMQRPNYPAGTGNFGFYYGWSGAHIDKTRPVRGCWLRSRYHADLICKIYFGKCWRMAEFHDGWYQTNLPSLRQGAFCEWDRHRRGGWNFFAYGNYNGSINYGRFWVAINDQRANCWDWS